MLRKLILVLMGVCLVNGLNFKVLGEEPVAGKTGSLTANFSTRSPLSTPKELSIRFGEKIVDDYKLADEPFLYYVPESYDPARPLGLIVLINYKDSNELPAPVLPILKEKYLALIVCTHNNPVDRLRYGLALDAVFSMSQLYRIDPARTYLHIYDHDHHGLQTSIVMADVFSGTLVWGGYEFWKPIRASNGGTYPPQAKPPPAKNLPLARQHPLVLLLNVENDEPEYFGLIRKALKGDGFRELMNRKVTIEDYHYPNYTLDWFTEVIDFMDHNAAARQPKPVATKPTTRPLLRPKPLMPPSLQKP